MKDSDDNRRLFEDYCSLSRDGQRRRKMFEDIGRPNLTNLLVLGAIGVVLPKLLPNMGPAVGTAVKIVIDLLTESEAEAAAELCEALVSSTMAEINSNLAGAVG